MSTGATSIGVVPCHTGAARYGDPVVENPRVLGAVTNDPIRPILPPFHDRFRPYRYGMSNPTLRPVINDTARDERV